MIGRSPSPTGTSGPPPVDCLRRLQRALEDADAPNIVRDYLRSRGLQTGPELLRGHRRLPYIDDEGKFIGAYPAMVAPVVGSDGSLQSVHRTYLGSCPSPRKKLMKPVDSVRGAAVRLFQPTNHLGVAEGIETAIAAHELFGTPTWALLSANGLETCTPPPGVRTLTIFGDNDANFAGHKAAYRLAHRLADQLEIRVRIPPRPGTDWLDVLNARKAA
jgi:putative DNA primase/helicase